MRKTAIIIALALCGYLTFAVVSTAQALGFKQCNVYNSAETWNRIDHQGGTVYVSSREYHKLVRTGLPDIERRLRYVTVTGLSGDFTRAELPRYLYNMGTHNRTYTYHWENRMTIEPYWAGRVYCQIVG